MKYLVIIHLKVHWKYETPYSDHYLWLYHITSTPSLPSIAGTITGIVKPSIAKPDL